MRRLEARYSRLHNFSMAAVAAAMVVAAIAHFATDSRNAPRLSFDDPRFVLFAMLALALGYYAWLGLARGRDRRPQVVIDRDGIALGFGRHRRFAWSDVQWVRIRRLALRPQLEIGLAAEPFLAANLGLSPWHLDDALRPVLGQPTSVLVRDNGLDRRSGAMLDAVRAFRPNLVR